MPKKVLAGFFTILSVAVLLLSIASAGHAQIPETMSYQGYLTDSLGNPVDGPVNLTFRIYDVVTGGTSLWSEPQSVTVNNGVYSVQLGAINTLTILNFDVPYWLGIEVETDGEMDPRQPFTTVPYAVKSVVSEIAESVAPGAVNDIGITGPISASKIEYSGLNADLIDDMDSTDFAAALHSHGSGDIAPQGGGSGLDADLLDGQDSADFAAASHGHGSADITAPLNLSMNAGGYTVQGINNYALGIGVRGDGWYGVWGNSGAGDGIGVYGAATSASGVNYGVFGFSQSPDGRAIHGVNTVGGYAGYFEGPVKVVAGSITGNGAGLTNLNWTNLTGVPAGFADGLDGDCDGVACELVSSLAVNCSQLGAAAGGEIYCSTEDDSPDSDAEVPDNITVDNTAGGFIRLEQGTAPADTTEGRLQWDTDDDRVVVGSGTGTTTFYAGPHTADAGQLASGTLSDARLSANVDLLNSDQNVTGVKHFAPFSASVPFTVDASKKDPVANLNADLLDGQHSSDIIAAAADEVRTPITGCGLLGVITQPGSYYLPHNLTGTTLDCITVNASNVTIDLMGFTISKSGTSTARGIFINDVSNVEIKNGTIANYYRGVYATNTSSTNRNRIINVQVIAPSTGGLTGIELQSQHSVVERCSVNGYSSYGIVTWTGAIIDKNIAFENGETGISTSFSVVKNNTASFNGKGIYAHGSIVTNNTSMLNIGIGIDVSHSAVVANTIFNNDTGGGGNPNLECFLSNCSNNNNYAP